MILHTTISLITLFHDWAVMLAAITINVTRIHKEIHSKCSRSCDMKGVTRFCFFFFKYWKNSLLKWDPKEYGGVKEIHVSPEDIWVPDTLLYNK